MKRLFLIALIIGVLSGVGCATKSTFEPISPDAKIPPTAHYEIGEIKDNSGFTASSEDINPALAMENALKAELAKAGLLGGEYKINVTITEYEPGNAFKRWILPGFGGTYLKTQNSIINPEGKVIASIPINRTVAAGGAFTIGAWQQCFQEVAEELIKVLKREMKTS